MVVEQGSHSRYVAGIFVQALQMKDVTEQLVSLIAGKGSDFLLENVNVHGLKVPLLASDATLDMPLATQLSCYPNAGDSSSSRQQGNTTCSDNGSGVHVACPNRSKPTCETSSG